MTPVALAFSGASVAVGIAVVTWKAWHSPEEYLAPLRDRPAVLLGAAVALYPLTGVREDPSGSVIAAILLGAATASTVHITRERRRRS
jgi:hypothetical protein